MPLPVITNCFRCSIEGTIAADPCVNVIHLLNAGGAGADSDCASDLGLAWVALIQTGGDVSTQYTAHSITVLPLDGTSASTSFVPPGLPFSGVDGSTPAPNDVARIGTLQTGVGGRSNRGRIYVGGMPGPSVAPSGAQWSSSAQADWATLWPAFLSSLSPGPNGSTLAVASYKLASARPVTAIVNRAYFGTQRRRSR